MLPQHFLTANVSNIVYDLLKVEIVQSTLFNTTFEYKICCPNEKIIRKGSFRGPNVQLRLSLMQEGKYSFHLFLNGEQIQYSGFEKMPAFAYS